jgi:putative protease
MKSEHYIATVVNAYRHAIDAYYKHQSVNDSIINDVYKAANREVSTG